MAEQIISEGQIDEFTCLPDFQRVLETMQEIKCLYCGADNQHQGSSCQSCSGPLEYGYLLVGVLKEAKVLLRR